MKYSIENELKKWLSGSKRIVVAGIGNPIRMDDFVGVKTIRDLYGKVSKNVYLIECETVPESFIQQIVDFKPTHILLIDAAVMGLKPGDLTLTEPENLTNLSAISTHALPLRIFCDLLAENIRVKIALLLIEPKETDFGEKLSPVVEASAKKITDLLLRLLR